MNENPDAYKVLIADDEPANLRTLAETLREMADITVARNGAEALERAIANPPDLVLLDIQMPEMDGYEVCRRMRADNTLKHIPVIFITTLDAEEDESRGFEVGGTDYITKPFSPPIVMARVKTQLELKQHRDRLEALAESRARQLVHAERLATLGTLAAGIAHEINNPLSCIMGYAEFLIRLQKNLRIEPDDKPTGTDPILDYVKDTAEYLPVMVEATDRITRIVAGMKGYAKREDEEFKLYPFASCVENSLKLCAHKLKYKVKAVTNIEPDLPLLLVRPQQIEQVLINLINNAAHAIQETGEKGLITIGAKKTGDRVLITVDDNGPGIPPAKLETIWEAFYTSKGDEGTGLGLSISRGIINEHGGEMSVENLPEGGARFIITLPATSG